MALIYNPSATFKTQIKELYGTDQLVPENFNPQFQDLLNNTGLLNDRLGTLEAANLIARMGAAEGNITTLQNRATTSENDIVSLDSRLGTLEGLNIPNRLAALESYKRFYGPGETPPLQALPGTLWLKDSYLLIKVGHIENSAAAKWQSITPYGFGLSFKDTLAHNQNEYRDIALPNSVAGLQVLRGIPNGVEVRPGQGDKGAAFIAVFWKVPPNATPAAFAEPSGGTAIYSFSGDSQGDEIAAITFHNIAPIEPGERLWIKLGLLNATSDVYCSVYTPLTLELRQG